MKGTELMIGDWVNYTEPINNRKVGIGDFLSPEELEPIPLTAEILEKNGFEIQEIRLWYTIYNSKYKNYTIVAYYDEDDGDVAIPFRGHWVYDENYAFDYVHELQHALRLCGLNELADNFKV